LAASLIYKSAVLYELAMMGLYGRHYSSRYRTVADLIPPESSVLDLCCGPAVLYGRYLRQKSVDYTGLDLNEIFIKGLIRRGVRAKVWDVRKDEPLPRADYVIMQASLYHFLPDPLPILNRMLEAAREQIIVAEPIRNLTCTKLPLLTSFARLLTDPGIGGQPYRFTERTLDDTMSNLCSHAPHTLLISGGREKIYVIQKH
jgi:SAM-dependent methyltransferase